MSSLQLPHSTTLLNLNVCPSALSQGWCTWWHDSALHQILDFLSLHFLSSGHLYGNIDVYRAIKNSVTTIPLDFLVTSDCPDIVFVNIDNSITIIELTIPFNAQESLDRAHAHKTKKYERLVSNLETSGHPTSFLALEIGTLGHYSPKFTSCLHRLLPVIANLTLNIS